MILECKATRCQKFGLRRSPLTQLQEDNYKTPKVGLVQTKLYANLSKPAIL